MTRQQFNDKSCWTKSVHYKQIPFFRLPDEATKKLEEVKPKRYKNKKLRKHNR
jgi:hypothetical protein